MKYRSDSLKVRFHTGCQAFCQTFFPWYNVEHYHSGLGLLTRGCPLWTGTQIIEGRREVLRVAYEKHPERFKRRIPNGITA